MEYTICVNIQKREEIERGDWSPNRIVQNTIQTDLALRQEQMWGVWVNNQRRAKYNSGKECNSIVNRNAGNIRMCTTRTSKRIYQ